MTAPFTHKLMKDLLENVRVGINNARKKPEVLEQLENYGINSESLDRGLQLQEEGESLFIGKGPRVGKKVGSSIRVHDMVDEVYDEHIFYLRMLRTDLKDDPVLYSEFNLKGRRDYSFSGKIKESQGFFQHCLDNPKAGEYVLKYGLTAEKIQGHLAEIAEIKAELENRATLKKDSELLTQRRNRVFRQLNDWYLNFRRILIHIFSDEPQKLEEFNINAYSEGYKPAKKKKNNGPKPVEEETAATPGEGKNLAGG